MTVDEAAEYPRCSASTCTRCISVRACLTKLGGRTVVRTAELERWLDDHTGSVTEHLRTLLGDGHAVDTCVVAGHPVVGPPMRS